MPIILQLCPTKEKGFGHQTPKFAMLRAKGGCRCSEHITTYLLYDHCTITAIFLPVIDKFNIIDLALTEIKGVGGKTYAVSIYYINICLSWVNIILVQDFHNPITVR